MLCCDCVQIVTGCSILSVKQCLFRHAVLWPCQTLSPSLPLLHLPPLLVSSCCVVAVSRDGVVSELGGVLFCQWSYACFFMLCCDVVQRRCSVRVRGCTVLSVKLCLFFMLCSDCVHRVRGCTVLSVKLYLFFMLCCDCVHRVRGCTVLSVMLCLFFMLCCDCVHRVRGCTVLSVKQWLFLHAVLWLCPQS